MLGSHEGWTICAALANGQEAVEKANELKPDVILDLAMPVMDGLTATREILRTLPTVPILIYTLHNIPAIELEAKKAGARKMVLKPHVELLISAMEEILGNEFGLGSDLDTSRNDFKLGSESNSRRRKTLLRTRPRFSYDDVCSGAHFDPGSCFRSRIRIAD